MTVYFMGAGPGDPELLTLKAHRILKNCTLVLYAGSLVPRAIVDSVASADCEVLDTAKMHLNEIIQAMQIAHEKGQHTARLHSGDLSLYSALGEQVRRLKALNIDFEVIPGVSAVSASAAWLGKELTLSGVTQTLILTRYAGKTPFPERERLPVLAQSGASLGIHLGVVHIHNIVAELIPHYGADCPVVVCYRTSWPDQDKVSGTLETIVKKVRDKKFTRTALILVGRALGEVSFDDSYLYDADQAHIFRPKKLVVEGVD